MPDDKKPSYENSLFHDLGQHLSNAYQQFLDSKADYAKDITDTPEATLAQAQSSQDPTPQEMPQTPTAQPQLLEPTSQQPQPMMQEEAPTPQQPSAVQQMGANAIGAQQNLANTAADVGSKEQSIYDKGLEQQQQLMDQTKAHFEANQAQDQQLMQAYMSKEIDPNHVINNMSNGSKIMTTLGLLFSGIGSGLTGQKNLALEAINNSISRDLEAQKANQGKAYNAYQMHREGARDQFTADMQYQKDNLIAINAAIEQQKAKLMSPQAQAAATQTQLGIAEKVITLNREQAQWDTMQQAMKNPASDPALRIRQMQLTGQLTPAQAEQAYKEADRVGNHSKQKSIILNSFDQADKENTIAGRASHLGSTPASVFALQNQLMPYLKDAEGRINETEIKRTDELIPKPGDSPHKIAQKRQGLINFMEEKSGSSLLKGLGLEQSQSMQHQETSKSKSGRTIFKNAEGKWEYAK